MESSIPTVVFLERALELLIRSPPELLRETSAFGGTIQRTWINCGGKRKLPRAASCAPNSARHDPRRVVST